MIFALGVLVMAALLALSLYMPALQSYRVALAFAVGASMFALPAYLVLARLKRLESRSDLIVQAISRFRDKVKARDEP